MSEVFLTFSFALVWSVFFYLYIKQAGEYSNGTACLECPKGHYCPSSSSTPIACQSGTYADTTSSTACQLCLAGYSCVDASQSPVSCSVGTYSVAGQIKCAVSVFLTRFQVLIFYKLIFYFILSTWYYLSRPYSRSRNKTDNLSRSTYTRSTQYNSKRFLLIWN